MDKPEDFTSFDIVAKLRRLLGTRKVGHAHTLDPMATGVLPIFVGRATKCCDILPDQNKRYTATFELGYTTDTLDATGRVLTRTPVQAGKAQVQAALEQFRGEIMQLPPMYSAIQINGRRLYDLARQGIEIEREKRPITIHHLELLEADEQENRYVIDVSCSKGTYIRTLCADIGEALGTKAHMGMLLRAQTGMFTLDDAHTIEEIDAADELSPLLTAMDQPLGHLPRLDVQPKAERFVRNGNRLTRRELIGDVQPGQPTRLYLNGQFCGIGRFDGETLKFDAMLLE